MDMVWTGVLRGAGILIVAVSVVVYDRSIVVQTDEDDKPVEAHGSVLWQSTLILDGGRYTQ